MSYKRFRHETLAVLEDYLDDFAGAVITVSHDRYFLDRTADRLMVFTRDGKIRQVEGSYSENSDLVVSLQTEAAENQSEAKADVKAIEDTRNGQKRIKTDFLTRSRRNGLRSSRTLQISMSRSIS
jgi:ATP-binding cassette subfamily F protein uup